MKKYIYICLISFFGNQIQAQTYNYTDLGILFSQDNNTGTARYTGLNGAMGAVGGDLSSININPAGIAVYNHGEISLTVGSYNYNNQTNYYNSTINNKSTAFNTDQAGAVFVFKDTYATNEWSKVSFAINYQKTVNFHTRNSFYGNSGFANDVDIIHPNDPVASNVYENVVSQDFYNYIDGKASKVNLALAGQYGKNFYAGFSLNLHHLEYTQSTELNKINQDDNDNTLDILDIETINENSDGFSINLGFIYKPIKPLRLGLAYQSPIWYDITEDYSSENLIASIPEENIDAATPYISNDYLDYELRTPSKVTASGALVIGKMGFINIDYTYKDYTTLNINSSITDFRDDNQYFTDILQNTHNINVGGEFRFQNTSLRGGLGYEQTPYKTDLDPRDTDILKLGDKYSGSLGAGFRFGNAKLDIAYRRIVQNNEYDFNDKNQPTNTQIEEDNRYIIDSGKINNKTSRIVATYSYSF